MTDEPDADDPLTDADLWQRTERTQVSQHEVRQHSQEHQVRRLYTRAHQKLPAKHIQLLHQANASETVDFMTGSYIAVLN